MLNRQVFLDLKWSVLGILSYTRTG